MLIENGLARIEEAIDPQPFGELLRFTDSNGTDVAICPYVIVSLYPMAATLVKALEADENT